MYTDFRSSTGFTNDIYFKLRTIKKNRGQEIKYNKKMKYLFFWLNNDVAHHSFLVIAIPCMQFINTLQVDSFVK